MFSVYIEKARLLVEPGLEVVQEQSGWMMLTVQGVSLKYLNVHFPAGETKIVVTVKMLAFHAKKEKIPCVGVFYIAFLCNICKEWSIG